MVAQLRRYVAFPSDEAADAVALWIAHAHALNAFECSPRLALISAEKQSGKTRCLDVVGTMVPDPQPTSNASVAAIFRAIDAGPPTLLMDECDTYLGPLVAKQHEDLRGIVNAGFERGATVLRCNVATKTFEATSYDVFAAMALAGIGNLPDTIMDRSVVIRMQRRRASERVESLRRGKSRVEGEAIRKKLAAWARAASTQLQDADPQLPHGIADRAADIWAPLISIAELAGPVWTTRAERAALKLCTAEAAELTVGVQLLLDIRAIFDRGGARSIPSSELILELTDLDESPWGDPRNPLNQRLLATTLRSYAIASSNLRQPDGRILKGYKRRDFEDVWTRYLQPRPAATAATTPRAKRQQPRRSRRNGQGVMLNGGAP